MKNKLHKLHKKTSVPKILESFHENTRGGVLL